MTTDERAGNVNAGDYERDWQRWHKERDTALASPHGFLAVTALHFLNAEPTRFPEVPGVWVSDARGLRVEIAPDETLELDGQPLVGEHDFGIIAERDGVTVSSGDLEIEVAKRGGFDILRPRDPANPRRTSFRRTPAYPADPAWVLDGFFTPFVEPRPTTVGAAVEGLEHVYDAVGEVTFAHRGRDLRLVAFPGHTEQQLQVLFTDETAGVTTHPAVRSLVLDVTDAGGAVRLDFNRAVNLPCAYTPYATCPLAPLENRLPIAVTAGELDPSLDETRIEQLAG